MIHITETMYNNTMIVHYYDITANLKIKRARINRVVTVRTNEDELRRRMEEMERRARRSPWFRTIVDLATVVTGKRRGWKLIV